MRIALLLTATISLGCIRAPIYPGSSIPSERWTQAAGRPGWAIEHVEVAPGVTVVGLERAPKAPDAHWILFFGGNGSSIDSLQRIVEKVAADDDVGLAVFAYRGFDGSDGKPSERALVRDAEKIRAHLTENHGVEPARLDVMGYSLGTGVAARLDAALAKAKTPAHSLVLVAPYLSIRRVASESIPCGGFLLADRWHTDRIVDQLTGPILIVHGSDDHVVGVHHGRDLARLLGDRATFVQIPHRGHDDVWRDPETIAAIRKFLLLSPTR